VWWVKECVAPFATRSSKTRLRRIGASGRRRRDGQPRASVTRDKSRRSGLISPYPSRVSPFTAITPFVSFRIPKGREEPLRTPRAAMPSAEIETPTPELMLAFYRRLYPFKSIFKWLNHEHVPGRLFTHREIAFTLQNDVYLRYNSFTTADEFKKQVCTLNPTRFEIGPVYTARVRDVQ